jgi:hypothetical protein
MVQMSSRDETACIATEPAMPHQSPELALVAIDIPPHRHDRDERIGVAAGPGWFDSSWDLRRGLEVREGWSDDERVHGWIEEFLATQRAIGRTASPRASTAIA